MFCDSHLHISEIPDFSKSTADDYLFCTSVHSQDDFDKALEKCPGLSCMSVGIHPQNPDTGLFDFLENVFSSKPDFVKAVGECGFDLFTEELSASLSAQKKVWDYQLNLALSENLPLVIHARKALPLFFDLTSELKKLPSVIFHSFPGSPVEAASFLKRGVNAYFSFGKPLLNGNKRARACVQDLSQDKLLLETDAPFQRLKDEVCTAPSDIVRVYSEACNLKKITAQETDMFRNQIHANFCAAYGM